MSFSIFGDGEEKESCGKCCNKHNRIAHCECEIKQHPCALFDDWIEATKWRRKHQEKLVKGNWSPKQGNVSKSYLTVQNWSPSKQQSYLWDHSKSPFGETVTTWRRGSGLDPGSPLTLNFKKLKKCPSTPFMFFVVPSYLPLCGFSTETFSPLRRTGLSGVSHEVQLERVWQQRRVTRRPGDRGCHLQRGWILGTNSVVGSDQVGQCKLGDGQVNYYCLHYTDEGTEEG